jgi:hypothetical protein
MPAHPEYRTLFEIGIGTFPWVDALHPFAFVVIGFALFWFAKSELQKAFGVVIGCFAIFLSIIATLAILPEAFGERAEYLKGHSKTVEGTVENFQGAPQRGPSEESFTVSGIPFSYNALDSTACFHNAPVRRGPVRTGLIVRITYDSACIQKVELRQ